MNVSAPANTPKVLHVFPSPSWGGAEMYVVELANQQKKQGLDVAFWGLKDSHLVTEMKSQNIPVIEDPLSWRFQPSALLRLAKKIRQLGISHIHLHWSGGVWAFWGIKLFCSLKVIYHVHLWMKHSKKDPLHWLLYKSVDKIVVAGEQARRAVLDCLPISQDKIIVCPYGRELESMLAMERTRRFWKLPEEVIIFGLFCRIDRQKGVKEFVEAILPLMENHPRLEAVMVGDPTHGEEDARQYNNEIQQLIQSSPHAKRFHSFPFQKNYLGLLKCCDVLVAPSYHESYSLIFLDAFAMEIPVLSTNAGGTPDLVTADRGWLVPPADVLSLQRQMERILQQMDFHVKGSSAKNYVMKNHSFREIIRRTNEIYQ